MRLRITHQIDCHWESPARLVNAVLRIMPRDHEGQTVVSWRIEPSVDGRLRSSDDAFGNLLHRFQADGPFETLVMRAEGVVETSDTAGVIRNAREPAPPMVFLRETDLTGADDTVRSFAAKTVHGVPSTLDRAHALMRAVAGLKPSASAPEHMSAAEAMTAECVSIPGAAHLLIAAARASGLPARFVSGHAVCQTDGGTVCGSHAWCEIHIERLGWVAFDPFLSICPESRHVRLAQGLDAQDAQAFRIARNGFGAEKISSVSNIVAV